MSKQQSSCVAEEKPEAKQCAKCGEVKLFNEFSPCRLGRHAYCKKCRNKQARESKSKDPYPARQAAARWRAKNAIAGVPCVSKEKKAEYHRRWRGRHRKSVNAHAAVKWAISCGVLTRPDRCQRCGKLGKVEGSHDDYSKPLNVEWLCRDCHICKDFGVSRVTKAADHIPQIMPSEQ